MDKDLAADYSVSEDGMTWTVTIRDDVKFTDGEPLTARDVAFTYNNCKEKSSVNDFTMLEEAVAVDDTTVEFHMTRPYSIWPYTMAIVGIVPEHAYDENYGAFALVICQEYLYILCEFVDRKSTRLNSSHWW